MNTENIAMAANAALCVVQRLRAALGKSYAQESPESRDVEIVLEDALRDACELQHKIGRIAEVIGGSK